MTLSGARVVMQQCLDDSGRVWVKWSFWEGHRDTGWNKWGGETNDCDILRNCIVFVHCIYSNTSFHEDPFYESSDLQVLFYNKDPNFEWSTKIPTTITNASVRHWKARKLFFSANNSSLVF